MGALMRSHDWAASPLGPPTQWPQSLRSVVGLLLTSKFPMFVAWGSELGFLYNDAHAEILGAKHPASLGARFRDIWSEIWPDIAPLIDGAMRGEASYRENLPLLMNRRGFSEQTWFTFSYSPVRDERGAVAGMFCAVAETTAQVRAQARQAFRLALEERLQELSDPQAVMVAAAEALGRELGVARVGYGDVDDAGLCVSVERDWTDGRVPGLTGRHRLDDFGPSLVAELREGRTLSVDDAEQDPRVGAARQAFASIHTRATLAVPLIRSGRFTAILSLHHPEPRRWSEWEISLVEEVADRTWAAVERARAEARRRKSEAGFRALRQIDKVTTLVNDLLDVSRISSGRFRLELEPTDLAAITREVVSRYAPEARRAGSTLELQLPASLPARSARLRVEQVVTNLVDNAIKYGAGLPIWVSLESEGDRARLTVRDGGIGIPPEARSRIFERFERAVSERNYGGLGLGLYISRTIVELLGGTIQVESEPGQGATFTVELPLEAAAALTQGAP